MAETITVQNIHEIHQDEENKLIFEKNVSIPLKSSDLPIRCNVYRPLDSDLLRYPVIATYGPYGKDIPYQT